MKLKYLFVFILCFMLFGCKEGHVDSDYKLLTDFVNSFYIESEIDHNIDLSNVYIFENESINASWSSDNPEAINNNGEVFKCGENQFAVLTATFSYNKLEIKKSFDVMVTKWSNEELLQKAIELVDIPSELSDNIKLPTRISFQNQSLSLRWNSDKPEILSNYGILRKQQQESSVTLKCTIFNDLGFFEKEYQLLVKPFNTIDMQKYLDEMSFYNVTDNLNLKSNCSINGNTYKIKWTSSNKTIVSDSGIIYRDSNDHSIVLLCEICIDDVILSKEYEIVIPKMSFEEILSSVCDSINIPGIINRDLYLPVVFLDDVVVQWVSSKPEAFSNDGKLLTHDYNKITLTATLSKGDLCMTKEFNSIISKTDHFIADSSFNGDFLNTNIINGKLCICDTFLEGSFTSAPFSCLPFNQIVSTWCSTSSENSTCELFIRVQVDNTWSDYVSYGEWGLGLKNACRSQTNSLIKMVEDEINVLSNKTSTSFQYKIVLKRKTVDCPSPVVSLVTFALNIPDYSFNVDSGLLKNKVYYDVPVLYQHDVPKIGNSICSCTSSTMLLKYKGLDFSAHGKYEHEYIANLVKDYGNNIFGNWVYNCVGMSSFGEIAYVKRFYSLNEMLLSIQEVGPMAASIKGTVNYTKQDSGQVGTYTSGGHLLVVTGFEILNGQTYVFINDPNVSGVKIKMTLQDFTKVWRMVSYVIE